MENIRNAIITPSRKLVKTCRVNGKYKKRHHHPQQKANIYNTLHTVVCMKLGKDVTRED
jgi:hypothetical protein